MKLGFINFGGPAGQITIMHRELVERERGVTEELFLRALTLCILLPVRGSTTCPYIDWRLRGTRGGIVCVFAL